MSEQPTTTGQGHVALFQEKAIRRIWQNEAWWFSVVDVCAALTGSPDAGAYWRKLKQRLVAEGSEVVTFCHGLKLTAPDGKARSTRRTMPRIGTPNSSRMPRSSRHYWKA